VHPKRWLRLDGARAGNGDLALRSTGSSSPVLDAFDELHTLNNLAYTSQKNKRGLALAAVPIAGSEERRLTEDDVSTIEPRCNDWKRLSKVKRVPQDTV